MKVLINGSKEFDDHLIFRRAMGVVMSDLNDDPELTLLLTGPFKTNDIARQFVNLTEGPFASRNKKLSYFHVATGMIDWDEVDKVVIFTVPPQKNTPIGIKSEAEGKEVHVFRY